MLSTDANYDLIIKISRDNDNDNANFCISVHLSHSIIINYVHVHYANFALIIVMRIKYVHVHYAIGCNNYN